MTKEARIIRLLALQTEPLSSAEIARRIGAAQNQTKRSLFLLRLEGSVERTGTGQGIRWGLVRTREALA
jgi:DNA-binding IclR family transcriptional regulator